MAVSSTISEIRRCIGWKLPNLPTSVGFIIPVGAANDMGVMLVWRRTWGLSTYHCAKCCSRTLAGFCCTLVDAEEQEEEDEEMTCAIPIYRVTTHLENLEKSGNSKMVREKSGESQGKS